MIAILKALFAALLAAFRDWRRDVAHDTAIRTETRATDELEDMQNDQDKADRITRAVDAVRNSGAGGVHADPVAPAPADTRGYRD